MLAVTHQALFKAIKKGKDPYRKFQEDHTLFDMACRQGYIDLVVNILAPKTQQDCPDLKLIMSTPTLWEIINKVELQPPPSDIKIETIIHQLETVQEEMSSFDPYFDCYSQVIEILLHVKNIQPIDTMSIETPEDMPAANTASPFNQLIPRNTKKRNRDPKHATDGPSETKRARSTIQVPTPPSPAVQAPSPPYGSKKRPATESIERKRKKKEKKKKNVVKGSDQTKKSLNGRVWVFLFSIENRAKVACLVNKEENRCTLASPLTYEKKHFPEGSLIKKDSNGQYILFSQKSDDDEALFQLPGELKLEKKSFSRQHKPCDAFLVILNGSKLCLPAIKNNAGLFEPKEDFFHAGKKCEFHHDKENLYFVRYTDGEGKSREVKARHLIMTAISLDKRSPKAAIKVELEGQVFFLKPTNNQATLKVRGDTYVFNINTTTYTCSIKKNKQPLDNCDQVSATCVAVTSDYLNRQTPEAAIKVELKGQVFFLKPTNNQATLKVRGDTYVFNINTTTYTCSIKKNEQPLDNCDQVSATCVTVTNEYLIQHAPQAAIKVELEGQVFFLKPTNNQATLKVRCDTYLFNINTTTYTCSIKKNKQPLDNCDQVSATCVTITRNHLNWQAPQSAIKVELEGQVFFLKPKNNQATLKVRGDTYVFNINTITYTCSIKKNKQPLDNCDQVSATCVTVRSNYLNRYVPQAAIKVELEGQVFFLEPTNNQATLKVRCDTYLFNINTTTYTCSIKKNKQPLDHSNKLSATCVTVTSDYLSRYVPQAAIKVELEGQVFFLKPTNNQATLKVRGDTYVFNINTTTYTCSIKKNEQPLDHSDKLSASCIVVTRNVLEKHTPKKVIKVRIGKTFVYIPTQELGETIRLSQSFFGERKTSSAGTPWQTFKKHYPFASLMTVSAYKIYLNQPVWLLDLPAASFQTKLKLNKSGEPQFHQPVKINEQTFSANEPVPPSYRQYIKCMPYQAFLKTKRENLIKSVFINKQTGRAVSRELPPAHSLSLDNISLTPLTEERNTLVSLEIFLKEMDSQAQKTYLENLLTQPDFSFSLEELGLAQEDMNSLVYH